MIVDESLLPARSRVDRRRTRRVDPFESRRSALGRDRRRGFAARIGGSRRSWLWALPLVMLLCPSGRADLWQVIVVLGTATILVIAALRPTTPRGAPALARRALPHVRMGRAHIRPHLD